MLGKKAPLFVILAASAVASQGAAQQSPEQREQAQAYAQAQQEFPQLLSEPAVVQEFARQRQELARQQEDVQREHAALEREYARQQADLVREHAARQRELASELSRTQALSAGEYTKIQQQMTQAREQLARAVGDVARRLHS